MSTEKKIEFLWNCAKALQGEQQTHKLLRSYYINTCRTLAKNNSKVPKEMFALSKMCPYCGSSWDQNEFELKSIPGQLKLSSKNKKLIEIYEKNDEQTKTLNRSQKNRAKWLKKRQFKRLAIKCQQCQHKSFINLEKKRSKSQTEPTQIEQSTNVVKQAGAHTQAAAAKQKASHTPALLQSKSKKKRAMEKPTTSTCNNRTKTNKSSAKKVISNTQKQNSLLQLAALLKKQTNVDRKSSSENKLQQLLK